MLTRVLAVVAVGATLFGCGLTVKPAQRTLIGISRDQVLYAAQHTMADEGMDMGEIDFEGGVLKSTWQKRNRQEVQYEVTAAPNDNIGVETPGVETVVISVSSMARNRIVGGWSEPTLVSSGDTLSLLDDIIALAISRFGPGAGSFSGSSSHAAPALSPGECTSSTDCAEGTHCTAGRCASECTNNEGCGEGGRCDDRGRCIPMPESFVPAAPPSPAGSANDQTCEEGQPCASTKS